MRRMSTLFLPHITCPCRVELMCMVFRFHSFFHHLDHYRTDAFLWVTAAGVSAVKQFREKNGGGKVTKPVDIDSDDEGRKPGEQEG